MRRILLQLFGRRTLRKVLLALFFLSLSLAIMIVPLEVGRPGASIAGLGDALWWATTTITSVGYGDVVPVTWEGRVIGVVLQVIGVLLMGSLIGSIVSELSRKRETYEWMKTAAKLDQITAELEENRRKLDFIILQNGEKQKKN